MPGCPLGEVSEKTPCFSSSQSCLDVSRDPGCLPRLSVPAVLPFHVRLGFFSLLDWGYLGALMPLKQMVLGSGSCFLPSEKAGLPFPDSGSWRKVPVLPTQRACVQFTLVPFLLSSFRTTGLVPSCLTKIPKGNICLLLSLG